jgi:regulatory protein
MPIITHLEAQKHDPERFNVYLDGSFGFGASLLLIVARGLAEGKALTDVEVEDLVLDDEVERAYGAALNLLSYRPRSRGEIDSYFRRKKSDPAIAQAVLGRLERAGLVDDHAFAEFWVRNRQAFRPRGSRALRAELRRKGLEGEIIDGALESLPPEEETAYEAGLKKLRSLRSLSERDFIVSMVGFLQRRGFGYAAAAGAAKRLSLERGGTADAADMLPAEEP